MQLDLTPEQAEGTVNREGLKRSSLDIIKASPERWWVIDKVGMTMLCWGYKSYPYHIYSPFEFVTFARAEEWVRSGSIGKLQEGWSTLDIGFHASFISKYTPYSDVT